MSRFLTAVGCSHPSIYLAGNVWKCSTCHNTLGPAAKAFGYGPCNHPAIVFRDGGAYCTECGARVQ